MERGASAAVAAAAHTPRRLVVGLLSGEDDGWIDLTRRVAHPTDPRPLRAKVAQPPHLLHNHRSSTATKGAEGVV